MEVINLTHRDKQLSQIPHIMAVGFFDGVHLGHQELLKHAKELARKQNILFTAMTFSPHPDEVLKGDKNRKYLMSLSQKIKKMESIGVDKLFVMEFDYTFASLLPAEFIQKYIVNSNTKHVVVGFDFTFGFKAQGNTTYLQKESEKLGFGLSVIPKKTYLQEKISSTLVRGLIQEGNVDLVPYYLGSNYEVSVHVLQYKINGNIIVHPSEKSIFPSPGSYLVKVKHGTKTLNGKFHQFSNSRGDNTLELNEPVHEFRDDCSIEFVSRVKFTESLSV
ncbi:riboflavin kinase : FMN adenylylate transferase (riboflavin biosynthesis) [Oceanobacillus iheyensis HTE831]|uniref:Riboflavin biosynthesis protein n=1 Tax=Oceanobacillus iheyensis (strain DSM 14371 / CIP 107618 / JCM 11309 / KCTC 3954 / HTE831) TaxID=221109 RepID=Q8CX90_OCEIH|nr:FAD synthetase family protein [Oceanobacillus iheyensis]BAC14827.1 riboflavin kinase : FMN adenylylate transferase (riboflavin biosynthesis) [Oceanobacillus iheyensis HTE831]